jgi:hypothetical protein
MDCPSGHVNFEDPKVERLAEMADSLDPFFSEVRD